MMYKKDDLTNSLNSIKWAETPEVDVDCLIWLMLVAEWRAKGLQERNFNVTVEHK